MNEVNLSIFRQELIDVLRRNILPYWMDKMMDPRGGFYGRRDGRDRLEPDAPKGAVLHARILWTFATAYRVLGEEAYLRVAEYAERYAVERFLDADYGGVYWSLNVDGTPLDEKKQFYALAFMLYGLAAYHRATGDTEALQQAIALFRIIEKHSRDRRFGGYIEATTRLWAPIPDMRLSSKDRNACKTMNTHLHIIEAYTELYRVWRNPELREAIAALLDLFFTKIENPGTHHSALFFDEHWRPLDRGISYGHDIEASWLLLEAARVLDDPLLLRRAMFHTARMADAASQGIRDDGSLIYEIRDDGTVDDDRHWWVQAECVVGQLYRYRYHGHSEALPAAWRTWKYIESHLVDFAGGEWHWSRRGKDGAIDFEGDKAGFWKCPYHNSRMVLEAVEHIFED